MDYKTVFRKLDETLADIAKSGDTTAAAFAMVQRIVDHLGTDLGLMGGRIYARRGNHYVLEREYPPGRAAPGFKIPVTYPPLQELIERGVVVHSVQDPGIDPEIERALGVKTFAAVSIDDRAQQIIAFSLDRGIELEEVVHTLSTIRHVVGIKLRQARLEGRVAEVRAIQMSLLPAEPPFLEGYELWAATVPAEEVGGDLFDYIRVADHVLGIAVADSAGHGLPAALQARDAIIGLRMGVEERMRITATVEKLNRVVGRSALASKFISLFYAEIDVNGTLVYCNAGHPPPLLYDGETFRELSQHGPVLGPDPLARYPRGYVNVEPGSLLLAYTDGIIEAENEAGESFGVERVRNVIRAAPSSARELVESMFREVRRFSGSEVPTDDQTVLALVRTEADRP